MDLLLEGGSLFLLLPPGEEDLLLAAEEEDLLPREEDLLPPDEVGRLLLETKRTFVFVLLLLLPPPPGLLLLRFLFLPTRKVHLLPKQDILLAEREREIFFWIGWTSTSRRRLEEEAHLLPEEALFPLLRLLAEVDDLRPEEDHHLSEDDGPLRREE